MDKIKKWSKRGLLLINVCLLLLCIKFYFDYAIVYESQVHETKILYPDKIEDIRSRELEINNLFLFSKILMVGLALNLGIILILFRKMDIDLVDKEIKHYEV